jgi:hypothetical protein
VDLIPTGELAVNQEPRDGDLTLSIYQGAAHDLGRYRLVYDDDLTILENTAVFDRAWLVGSVRWAGDEETLDGLKCDSLDLRTTAWAAEEDRPAVGESPPPGEVRGEVRATRLRSSAQRFEVNAEREGYLIVSDNYDRHWRARIDGCEVPIFRANYNLRGVRVPAGAHTVEFSYRPPYFLPSMAVALGTTIVFLFTLAHCGWRRSRVMETAPPAAARQTLAVASDSASAEHPADRART